MPKPPSELTLVRTLTLMTVEVVVHTSTVSARITYTPDIRLSLLERRSYG